jgi:hypothetical protein
MRSSQPACRSDLQLRRLDSANFSIPISQSCRESSTGLSNLSGWAVSRAIRIPKIICCASGTRVCRLRPERPRSEQPDSTPAASCGRIAAPSKQPRRRCRQGRRRHRQRNRQGRWSGGRGCWEECGLNISSVLQVIHVVAKVMLVSLLVRPQTCESLRVFRASFEHSLRDNLRRNGRAQAPS